MKKKKILFIIWSFTYGGGAERVLANIVNNLDKNRYDIDIIEYWHTNINNEEINDNVTLLEPIIDADNDSILKKILYNNTNVVKVFLTILSKDILERLKR